MGKIRKYFTYANVVTSITIIGVIITASSLSTDIDQNEKNMQRETKAREDLATIIELRKPIVEHLEAIIFEVPSSYRIIVPIRNISRSEIAIANRVSVSFNFGLRNRIVEIDPGSYKVTSIGKDSRSVTFEYNYIAPQHTVYPSVITENQETPNISITWAEKTGYENIPLLPSSD